MARYMTGEEVENEHLQVLGPELGRLYHRLYNECAWLQIKWAQYVELFGSKSERIDLLNRAAALFFRVVQDSLWEDTLMHLARLTDPEQSGPGKENLTLRRLPALVCDELRDDVGSLVNEAVNATAFARDWRNRHIAHRDLALALEEGARPLEPASRASVKEAIAAVSSVLVRTHAHYFKSDLALHLVSDEPGGAESLLYVVRDGVEADEAQRKRFEEGNPLPDDLRPPRAV